MYMSLPVYVMYDTNFHVLVYILLIHIYGIVGTLQYNAQSPDEAALVAAAKNFGFVFKVHTDVPLTLFVLQM
jgi:phospholipid-translocating ATPase